MMEESSGLMIIDEAYEFSAPRFYDFIDGETEDDVRKAELWFDTALSYAPSPCMPRIRTGRSIQMESLCDFSETEQLDDNKNNSSSNNDDDSNNNKETVSSETTMASSIDKASTLVPKKEEARPQPNNMPVPNEMMDGLSSSTLNMVSEQASENKSSGAAHVGTEVCCTPVPSTMSKKKGVHTELKKHQSAKKIASLLRNPSVLKSNSISQQSKLKSSKLATVKRDNNVKSAVATPNFAQENQAIKRQKLEGGKSRQILSIKPQTLTHKTRPGVINSSSNTSAGKTRKEDRKMYVREPAVPFVSMAEMMKKFQSNTREMSVSRKSSALSHDCAAAAIQRKPKLTLTRPKEPEFETSQRARAVKIKSSDELEEEMMAKMPKFKARPLNKKILETPTLPALPRSTPQVPEFKEFHLETMTRANKNAETSTVVSTETAQTHEWKPHLTAPKSPVLQTSLRARPPKIKSSEELEKEELEKAPKFKARPLNKKIFESKGELGIFCNAKRQVTVPQEFHFAIDERIPPPATVADLFDKLSLNSEAYCDKYIPKNTTPNPFHLHTEERGADKEKKFITEIMQKRLEEERARIPKANPYPYTTDYPVIPPKPEPKQCTKPEPFQLESLTRHEEEMQREMEERRRIEMEEAQKRVFKAQPILKEDPIPVPEKPRRPLTEVQEFNLHVEHRAVDRAEFDKKIKEKEMMYKRYREEAECAKLMEEEKALKQLRRTLVPHARPVPDFNHPFLPQKSAKQVTKPKSPKLHVIRRRENRNLYCPVAAAISRAASNMR